MTLRAFVTLLTSASILLSSASLLAQETAPAETPAKTIPDDIPTLIKNLDANRFSQRQDASRKLKALGASAIDALAQAALGTSREASSRALEILKGHFASQDKALQEAAKAAFEKLAASDKAPIARKANAVLHPKPPAPQLPRMAPMGVGGQIQIQFQGGAANRIQVRNQNGVKDIDVKEDGRSIKIHDDPNKGITVEVTEKKDGKDVKKKYAAKDAKELKKKHPEAHKIYEKYNQAGPIQIQGIQIPNIQFQQMGRGIALPGRRKLINPEPLADQLEKISTQVDEAHKILEKLKPNSPDSDSLQKALEQLEKAKKELKEARSKIG